MTRPGEDRPHPAHGDPHPPGPDRRPLLRGRRPGPLAARVHRTADWHTAHPWPARATGHNCPAVEEYDFGYGPAHFLTPDEVARVAEGLRAEHWALASHATRRDPEAEEPDATAVLGGIS
ncbi:hypothetical protein ACVNF4_27100 [Streptomyces sp. S6]